MNSRLRHLIAPIAVSVFCSANCFAQTPKRDAKVQAALDQMTAAYKALSVVHIKMVAHTTVSDPSIIKSADIPESIEIKLQRPNKLVLDIWRSKLGSRVHVLLVSDGVNLWKWNSSSAVVEKSKAPAAIFDIKDLPNDSPEMDILLRGNEPFKDFSLGGSEASLSMGGTAKVGDADTDSIELRLPAAGSPISGTLQIRLGQRDHFVRNISFEGGGKDPRINKDVKFKFEVTYPILNPAPVFTTDDFRFVPPAGAKIVVDRPERRPVAPDTRKESK